MFAALKKSLTESPHRQDDSILGVVLLIIVSAALGLPLTLSNVPLVAGVFCILFYRVKNGIWPTYEITWPVIFILIIALIFSSSFWSITPNISLDRSKKIASILLFFIPLLAVARNISAKSFNTLTNYFIYPVIIASIALFVELKWDFPLYRFFAHINSEKILAHSILNKHVSTLILFAPFALFFAHQNKQYVAALLASIFITAMLIVTESQAAQLASIVMVLTTAGMFIMPQLMRHAVFIGLSLLWVFLPWVAPILFDAFAETLNHKGSLSNAACASMRLENWDFISRKIQENPWTGFGVDSTRSILFDTDEVYFPSNSILHPHNVILQTWIEFGILGPSLSLTILYILHRRINHLSHGQQYLPMAIFCGTMVFLLVSWSMWASWLIGLVLFLAVLLTLVLAPKNAPSPS